MALLKFLMEPTSAAKIPACWRIEDTLFAVMELTEALEAINEPIWAVKEEMELPTYWFTRAEPDENCWTDNVVTPAEPTCAVNEEMELPTYWFTTADPDENCRTDNVVTPMDPTWDVNEEMELPTYWFTTADPEDKLLTLTEGVLMALIAMLPVDNDKVLT